METHSVVPAWHRILPLLALTPAALLPGGGSLGSLAIVLLTLVFVKASRRPTLALRWKSWPRDILLGVLVGIALWAAFRFATDPALERLFGRIILDDFSGVRGNLANYLVLLAVGLVYGGIVEEVVFRGYVVGWGTALWGERSAVPLMLLSSAVFGYTHLYQGWAGAVSAVLTGLAFGGLYIACGRRLLPAILSHIVLDAIGITEIYLGTSA